MNRTPIDWVKNPDGTQGYTLNSKTGCLNHTPEGLCRGGMFPCFAYGLANGRLRERYLANKNIAIEGIKLYQREGEVSQDTVIRAHNDPFYPRFWPEKLNQIRARKKPAGIFLDDMSDWMGDYWPEELTRQELQVMRDCLQHRIYTLTKQPQNLIKFSPFPDNCWVGVTATDETMARRAIQQLRYVQANVQFLSLEPLLGEIRNVQWNVLNWVIIGACTGKKGEIFELCKKYPELTPMPYGKMWTAQPQIECVEEIVQACDKAGIPVFLKDNLVPMLKSVDYILPTNIAMGAALRQEMPEGRCKTG